MTSTIAFFSAETRTGVSTAPTLCFGSAAHCERCRLRELCLPAGLTPQAIRLFGSLFSKRVRMRRRESLYRSADPFDAVYAIRLGTFKTLMLAEDGREQITGFFMGGEIVGADGISCGHHRCAAVALEDSEVCVLPFESLEEFAHEVPALRHNLYRLISQDVCRSQDMMFLLGSMRAEQRLVAHLLNLAARYRARGYSGTEFILRMTREEIASMLGLKLETISRLFSQLQGEGLIQVQGRSVKLLDPAALRWIVGKQSQFES
jgi:CRP/FNR family transcriptional regulator, anaerobic regulatory protein